MGDDYPVGSAGLRAAPRRRGGGPALESTCMVQYHPATGALLLFHSNLNKWTLNVPTRWPAYRRRWSVIVPPGWRFVKHHEEAPPLVPVTEATAHLGYDVERACWEFLLQLRCAPWFETYIAGHSANAAEAEHVFLYAPEDRYNAFVLDEHMTGKFEPEEATPRLDDGIDDQLAARTQPAGGGRAHDAAAEAEEAGVDDARGDAAGTVASGAMQGATHKITPAMEQARLCPLFLCQPPTPITNATLATLASPQALGDAFLDQEGLVMEVAAMEQLADEVGIDLVTLYIWWDGRSKEHEGGRRRMRAGEAAGG